MWRSHHITFPQSVAEIKRLTCWTRRRHPSSYKRDVPTQRESRTHTTTNMSIYTHSLWASTLKPLRCTKTANPVPLKHCPVPLKHCLVSHDYQTQTVYKHFQTSLVSCLSRTCQLRNLVTSTSLSIPLPKTLFLLHISLTSHRLGTFLCLKHLSHSGVLSCWNENQL